MPLSITLPDGTRKSFDNGSTAFDVASSIGSGLAAAAIGCRFNGERFDLHRPLPGDGELALVTAPRLNKKDRSTFRDEAHRQDALFLLRHSTAHVMAEAIADLFPGTLLAYGPPLDNGFYYDLKLDTPISSDDFARIEERMAAIVAEKRPFTRTELPPEAGLAKLQNEHNKYKLDNARRALEGGATTLSWYATAFPARTGTTCAWARTWTTPAASGPSRSPPWRPATGTAMSPRTAFSACTAPPFSEKATSRTTWKPWSRPGPATTA